MAWCLWPIAAQTQTPASFSSRTRLILTWTVRLHLAREEVAGHVISTPVPRVVHDLYTWRLSVTPAVRNAGKYSIMGQVLDGMEVLDRMEKVPTGPEDKPLTSITLKSVTIHANPIAK